ncbi:MAG TPA: NAD-dependent epimerase/dehydratase family protein [Thermoanaerobaculia bacterium]|jgi:nucleoside-diphosphate-sugar epimerase|nr:NAD-dependent epimerase/dehydratase family protein [Thermoanaerobaculia bacterium]
MRVLVTGGTGFTGKALVKRLLDQGHEVVALDYKEGLKTRELRDWGAEVVLGSVTDREVVRRAVDGAEVVHHLAAAFRELNVPDRHYREVNVGGTRNVLEAAKAAGVRRFVYCSTCGVHGNVDHSPGGEDAPIQPADYYQRTKYEAEPLVRQFHEQGLPAVILRPAAIYGPGDPERFLLIYRRVARGRFPMFGDGRTLYHPLYVDNLVDAFLAAMADGRGDGEAYLIADEEYVQIEDLVRRVGRSLGVEVRIPHFPVWPVVAVGHVVEKACRPFGIAPPIFPRRVDWYRQNRAFRIDKAKRDLGWAPRVGLDEGLRRTAEWYRQEGYL